MVYFKQGLFCSSQYKPYKVKDGAEDGPYTLNQVLLSHGALSVFINRQKLYYSDTAEEIGCTFSVACSIPVA